MTTKGRYALRACLAMAQMSKDGAPVSIRQLSDQEQLSSVFLEQLFFKLRKAGLVESVRGPGGGFRFSKSISQITILSILDAVGEGLYLAPCGEPGHQCEKGTFDCLARSIWAGATATMADYFSRMTIADAIKNACEAHEVS